MNAPSKLHSYSLRVATLATFLQSSGQQRTVEAVQSREATAGDLAVPELALTIVISGLTVHNWCCF